MREGEQASPELRSGDLGSNDAGVVPPVMEPNHRAQRPKTGAAAGRTRAASKVGKLQCVAASWASATVCVCGAPRGVLRSLFFLFLFSSFGRRRQRASCLLSYAYGYAVGGNGYSTNGQHVVGIENVQMYIAAAVHVCALIVCAKRFQAHGDRYAARRAGGTLRRRPRFCGDGGGGGGRGGG